MVGRLRAADPTIFGSRCGRGFVAVASVLFDDNGGSAADVATAGVMSAEITCRGRRAYEFS